MIQSQDNEEIEGWIEEARNYRPQNNWMEEENRRGGLTWVEEWKEWIRVIPPEEPSRNMTIYL